MKTPADKTVTFTYSSHPTKDVGWRWTATLTFPAGATAETPPPFVIVNGNNEPVNGTLEFAGRRIPVSRTGAWGTRIEVVPGTNVLEIGDCRRTFVVAKADKGRTTDDKGKVYGKLPYSADKPARHAADRKPAEIAVVIDAGHGGDDKGATSPHGLPEKDANLRLAKAVRNELVKRGYKVVMTREDDTFVELYDRPKVAHKANADLFVSIHHNAPGYASNPFTIRSQSVYAWNALGERLAKAINGRMAAADPMLANDGVLHANFAVTRNPEIPSCLIEADFITHPDGEIAAWDFSHRPVVATAIADGIADWVAGK